VSPVEIGSSELYDGSTRFLHDWHRETFGPLAEALDVDLVGRCPDCYRMLYVIEATTRRDKPTAFLEELARLCRVPAILWIHDRELTRVLQVRLLGRGGRSGDEEYGKDLLDDIRAHHRERCPLPGRRTG
jgi:hypothetical protein